MTGGRDGSRHKADAACGRAAPYMDCARGAGGARLSMCARYTACPGLRIHSLPKRADASVAPEDCLICCTATWGATKIVLKRAGIHRSTNCSVSGEVEARIH